MWGVHRPNMMVKQQPTQGQLITPKGSCLSLGEPCMAPVTQNWSRVWLRECSELMQHAPCWRTRYEKRAEAVAPLWGVHLAKHDGPKPNNPKPKPVPLRPLFTPRLGLLWLSLGDHGMAHVCAAKCAGSQEGTRHAGSESAACSHRGGMHAGHGGVDVLAHHAQASPPSSCHVKVPDSASRLICTSINDHWQRTQLVILATTSAQQPAMSR